MSAVFYFKACKCNEQPHLHGIRPALVVEARRTLAVLQNLLESSLEQAVGHPVAVAGDRIENIEYQNFGCGQTVIGTLAELIKKDSRKLDLYAVDCGLTREILVDIWDQSHAPGSSPFVLEWTVWAPVQLYR